MSGYSTPGFFEKKIERETAARVAAFLGGLGRGSENLGATGVRSDWMEQDGPAVVVPFFEELYGNRRYGCKASYHSGRHGSWSES